MNEDELTVTLEDMVEAGMLASDGGEPPRFITSGLGAVFLDLARECAVETGVSENICFNLLSIGNQRRLDYERAVANRLYVRAVDGDGFACGCPRESFTVRNMVCRTPECLGYGEHVRGLPGDHCQWCGELFILLSDDSLRGAR